MKNIIKLVSASMVLVSFSALMGCPPPALPDRTELPTEADRTRACSLILKYGGTQAQVDSCNARTTGGLTDEERTLICNASAALTADDEAFLRSVLTDEQEATCSALNPTTTPTDTPTGTPTDAPTSQPTSAPTDVPTSQPTSAPTAAPTSAPTATPTPSPTPSPSDEPYYGGGGGGCISGPCAGGS